MRKILPLLVLIAVSFIGQAQTLEHKLTPYLYLGAPKEKLIEVITTQARLIYEANVDNVIGRQRSKGIKLKKKEALQRYINEMTADLRSKLIAKNEWSSDSIDIWRTYSLSIQEMMGAGIQLKGFDELTGTRGQTASISFKNGKVCGIFISRSITSALNPTTIVPLSNQVINQVGNILEKYYDENYKGNTMEGKVNWNSENAIYDRRIDYYYCEDAFMDIFGDYAGKINFDVTVYYEPYGREVNYRYYHQGQALSTIEFYFRTDIY